jgi:hypothetical protein
MCQGVTIGFTGELARNINNSIGYYYGRAWLLLDKPLQSLALYL